MTNRPEPDEIIAMARIAGVPIDDATAQRIIRSIGPALDGFAPVAGGLRFDVEPASFVVAQSKGARS